MTTLENRLRSAYQEAAGTVAPATVRGLDELTVPRSRRTGRAPRGLARTLVPVTAALTVAAVATLAVIVPKVLSGPPAAATAWPRFVVTGTGPPSATELEVHNLATGALTGQIGLTDQRGGQSPGTVTKVGAVATGNGRTFVVALYRSAPCRSWLYQFRLDSQGKPSALTPFSALPSMRYAVTGLAVSENGQKLAFVTEHCAVPPGYLSPLVSLGVTSIGTGQTRQWAFPVRMRDDLIRFLSLTANGGLLAFSDQVGLPPPIWVMATRAAPGSVAERGRIALRLAINRSTGAGQTEYAVISADGKTAYLTTESSVSGNEVPGNVRAGDVRTGRLRYLRHGGVILAASPSVRYLLLEFYSLSPPPSAPCVSHCPRVPKHPASRYPELPRVQLGRLDLATGKITYLPSGWADEEMDIWLW